MIWPKRSAIYRIIQRSDHLSFMGFEWVIQVPILLFSIILHEFAHGGLAYLRGDDTAERAGRLTLNPLPHIDPFGTVLLPALCVLGGGPVFGWARPVPVDPYRLQGKKDLVAVSLVGPFSNMTLAIACALAFRMSFATAPTLGDFQQTLAQALRFGVVLNLYLAVFNLLPVYPLDGSQALVGLLPPRWAQAYEAHAPFGSLIILLLLMTGLLSAVLLPGVRLGWSALAATGLVW